MRAYNLQHPPPSVFRDDHPNLYGSTDSVVVENYIRNKLCWLDLVDDKIRIFLNFI